VDTSGAPERHVTVEGKSILCGSDPVGLPIGAALRGLPICPTPRTNTTKPCEKTVSVKSGQSDFVFVEGDPVSLSTLVGTTEGFAPAPGVEYAVDDAHQGFVNIEDPS
jgi:hypothetical protein